MGDLLPRFSRSTSASRASSRPRGPNGPRRYSKTLVRLSSNLLTHDEEPSFPFIRGRYCYGATCNRCKMRASPSLSLLFSLRFPIFHSISLASVARENLKCVHDYFRVTENLVLANTPVVREPIYRAIFFRCLVGNACTKIVSSTFRLHFQAAELSYGNITVYFQIFQVGTNILRCV